MVNCVPRFEAKPAQKRTRCSRYRVPRGDPEIVSGADGPHPHPEIEAYRDYMATPARAATHRAKKTAIQRATRAADQAEAYPHLPNPDAPDPAASFIQTQLGAGVRTMTVPEFVKNVVMGRFVASPPPHLQDFWQCYLIARSKFVGSFVGSSGMSARDIMMAHYGIACAKLHGRACRRRRRGCLIT